MSNMLDTTHFTLFISTNKEKLDHIKIEFILNILNCHTLVFNGHIE